jgi:hypothetical protein
VVRVAGVDAIAERPDLVALYAIALAARTVRKIDLPEHGVPGSR